MSTTDILHGYDQVDPAEAQSGPTIVPFNDNVGVCTGGRGYTFPSSGDRQIKVNFKATEGPNKGLQFTLSLPAAPKYDRKDGDIWVPVDEENTIARAAIHTAWVAALKRLVVACMLAAPTAADLATDDGITAWVSKGEGAQVVFGGYDSNGFGAVRCLQNQQNKNYIGSEPFRYAVGVSGAEEAAKNRKGELIPGKTRIMQARDAIATYEAKQAAK